MTPLEWVLWGSVAFVLLTYAGYPAAVLILARLLGRPPRPDPEHRPRVSVCVACHNEAERISAKLDDLATQDYPGELLEILVAMDGCTDGTAALVAERAESEPRIRGLDLARGGKPSALNAAVDAASGEVLVFMDARQRVNERAVSALVAILGDPAVGGASGELVQAGAEAGAASEGVGLYWRYERAIRAAEARLHSTVGTTGALWALEAPLWRPLPADTILDDVVAPMEAVLAGKRVVLEPGAVATDRVSDTVAGEFSRKTRTLSGNYQALARDLRLWLPWRNPVWLQMLCHKVARLGVPWALLAILATSVALAPGHPLYTALLAAQGLFYAAALLGLALRGRGAGLAGRLVNVPYVFCALNLAAVVGGLRWLTGAQAITWRA